MGIDRIWLLRFGAFSIGLKVSEGLDRGIRFSFQKQI